MSFVIINGNLLKYAEVTAHFFWQWIVHNAYNNTTLNVQLGKETIMNTYKYIHNIIISGMKQPDMKHGTSMMCSDT